MVAVKAAHANQKGISACAAGQTARLSIKENQPWGLTSGQVLLASPLGHGAQRGGGSQPKLAMPILRGVQGFDHKGIAVGVA